MTKHPLPLQVTLFLTLPYFFLLFLTLSYSFLLTSTYLLAFLMACNALGPEKLRNELQPRERQESLFPLSAGRRYPGNRNANLSLCSLPTAILKLFLKPLALVVLAARTH